MRRIIAAMQASLDGFIEGPHGELDWVETWDDPFELLAQIDTLVLGGGMYPGYEQYWRAILADPEGVLAFIGRVATPGEIAYARFADTTPHVVLSRTLTAVDWNDARIVRDVEAIAALERQPGRDMHAVGGAGLVSSLMNHELIDELRLVVHPVILGAGKAPFKDVEQRHALTFVGARALASGSVCLTYRAR